MKKKILAAMSVAPLFASAPLPVQAQDYPNKPIPLIVPYPPRGGDRYFRALLRRLHQIALTAPGLFGPIEPADRLPDGFSQQRGRFEIPLRLEVLQI